MPPPLNYTLEQTKGKKIVNTYYRVKSGSFLCGGGVLQTVAVHDESCLQISSASSSAFCKF